MSPDAGWVPPCNGGRGREGGWAARGMLTAGTRRSPCHPLPAMWDSPLLGVCGDCTCQVPGSEQVCGWSQPLLWSLHTRRLLSCGMQSPVLGLRGVLAQRQRWEKRPGLRVPIGGAVGLGGGLWGVGIFAVDVCLVGPVDGGAAWPISGASSGGVAVFWK